MSAPPVSSSSSAPPASPDRLGEVLLWLLLALLAFNLPQPPVLELDSSWRQALAYFLHRDYAFGQDVVFTYGPLGFLMGNTYTGAYFWAYVAYHAGFAAVAATLIVVLGRPLQGVPRFAYFAYFILWGVGYSDALHMMVIAFTGWIILRAERPPAIAWTAVAGLGLALLAVIKFTNLLFAGFVVAAVVVFLWIRNQRRPALVLGATFGFGFLLLWLLSGQSPGALPAYVKNSLDVSSGYQAAMGLPTPEGQLGLALWTMTAGAGYVLWHLFTQPDRVRSITQLLILAAFLFLNWKHGFVRADGHMLGYFYCALVPAVAFPALFRERLPEGRTRWIPRALLLAVAGFSLAGMRGTFTSNIDYAPNITNERLQRHLQAVLNWSNFRARLQGQVDHWRREADLPRTRALTAGAPVDVLGFEQAIALFNDFNYSPRPVFQSYSVYTPHLARLNADWLASPAAAEFLLVKLQTIDERPLLLDDSHVMALLPHLYTFQLTEKDFHVFRRRSPAPDPAGLQPRLVRTLDLPPGTPLDVSDFGSEPLWLEIDLPFSLLGRARNFLYKPPFVHLDVTDHQGETVRYRLPLSSARAGFQINPLVTDFTSYLEAHGGAEPRRVAGLTLEVADADRRFFAEQALVSLSLLPTRNLKAEYEKQLEREKFSLFSALPTDFSAATPPSKVEIDGREALVMHAPSSMQFDFRAGTARLHGAHGYPPNAYSNGGETDGADFRIVWTNGTETRELYRRTLDPLNVAGDRGLIDFDLDVGGLPDGVVTFEVGIRGHPGWDWTAWSTLTFE